MTLEKLIDLEAGALASGNPSYRTTLELQGLRSDKSRPGDVIWLGYSGPGRHLLIDGSIVGVFTNTTARESSRTPGHAAACNARRTKSSPPTPPPPPPYPCAIDLSPRW